MRPDRGCNGGNQPGHNGCPSRVVHPNAPPTLRTFKLPARHSSALWSCFPSTPTGRNPASQWGFPISIQPREP